MTLMLYGQTEPEEAPADSGRRRYLIILGMVVVLILGGGSAAYLLLNSSVPANHAALPGGYPPPAVDPTVVGPTDDASASPTASAGPSATASASASASRSVTPTHTPAGQPPAGGGGPAPLAYRLTSGQLCPAMDFTTIQQNVGAASVASDHKPGEVDYSCTGGFGPVQKVKVFADALIFPSTTAATASYTGDKAGGDHVMGVGSDAAGLFPVGGGFTLLVLDANLELKIHLIAVGGQPVPTTLRQWAIDSARGTLPHLHS